MSAEVTIALGVAGRVLANIVCANNPRFGAALVGLSNGFLIHHAWLADTLFDPFTLFVLGAGIVFDHKMYGDFEEVVTELLTCGLGVVLADFGPDLWYELVGESFGKEVARELDALGLGGLVGDGYYAYYDSASDDDRSDAGSVSVVSRSSRRSRTSRMGTSVTVRPSSTRHREITRPRPRPAPSTATRLSRVTFDESSITQSQGSEADVEEYLERDVEGLTTTGGDALSGGSGGMDDLYMEPSTTSSPSRSETERGANGSVNGRERERPQTTRRPSILRRLHIPGQETTTVVPTTTATFPTLSTEPIPSESANSSRTRLTSDGETTPRATTYPRPDFTPLMPPSGFELPSTSVGAGPSFPEPDLTSSVTTTSITGYDEYSPKVVPPSEPTPDISTSIALPEPVHFPDPSPISSISMTTERTISPEIKHEDHGPSIFGSIMNVPIVPPPEERDHHQYLQEDGHLEPSAPGGTRSRSRSRERERSRSPAGPRPQPPPSYYEALPPAQSSQVVTGMYGPASFISESFEDSTIDVRSLTREEALLRIEEAWKNVEKKHQRRLNVLVRHDDDELQTSARKNSTFHLMEDLENLRFNFKIRPGIIIITSRSRG